VNIGRSASGRPSNSQITESGSVRAAVDQIGRTSLRKQLAGEFVGDSENPRFHFKNRPAAEGFIDNIAQPSMIRFVLRQHMVGQRPHHAGHPPLQSGDAADTGPNGERFAVLQDPIGQILRGRGPDLPDHRELHLDHGTSGPQLLDLSGGIAKVRLADKVGAHDSSLQLQATSVSTNDVRDAPAGT
jgi:hypothetical protein